MKTKEVSKNSCDTALIICNGELPDKRILRPFLRKNPLIVCVDGGANSALKLHLIPHVIIGDFDSISEQTEKHYLRTTQIKFIYLRRQTDTDFEKALRYVTSREIPKAIIVGATGNLLDHTLGNFSILVRFVSKLEIKIIDTNYFGEFVNHFLDFKCVIGSRISLIPLPGAVGITTSGLKYQLSDESLEYGVREGTCNEATAEHVRINLRKGILLILRPHPSNKKL